MARQESQHSYCASDLFIHWNVFLVASLSIIKSQQCTSYFVQFIQQFRKIYRTKKTINYPEGANRNELRCFWQYPRCSSSPWNGVPRVLYSKMSVRVGKGPLLHCNSPDLGYVEQLTTCRRRSKLMTSRHCGEETTKFLEIDSLGHFQKYTSMSSAGSWTALGQEASADHPSSEPRCAKTLVASEWVERPRSSSAAPGQPWWRSFASFQITCTVSWWLRAFGNGLRLHVALRKLIIWGLQGHPTSDRVRPAARVGPKQWLSGDWPVHDQLVTERNPSGAVATKRARAVTDVGS